MPLPANVKNKVQGDIIRSADWNTVAAEVDRLDAAKANLSGAIFTGPLTIGADLKVRSMAIVDANNAIYANNWIGMGVVDNAQWLHIGGISDRGVRRLGLFADHTHISGNLGIGVTNPSTRLAIAGSASIVTGNPAAPILSLVASGGDMSPRLEFKNTKNDVVWHIAPYEPNNTSLHFWCNKFTSGNVLEMKQDGSLQFATLRGQKINLYTQEFGIGIQDSTLYFRTFAHYSWHRGGVHNNAENNAGGGVNLMRLDTNGDLQIKGGVYVGNSDIYFSKTDHVHTGFGNPPGHAAIENSTAPYNTFMILGRMIDNRRKIGMWNDVTVHGDFFVPNLPFGDRGNAQFEASTGKFFYDNSSRRYKTNIQPLEDDFKKMLQLQPRTYTRDHSPEHTEIGYIAEELQSLGLNKLVYYDDKGQPDGLNYTKMCMYLLEILRDHEAKLNPKSPYLERYVEASDTPGKKSATKSNSKK